jgi:predicted Ser/Thr protein kinase
MPRDVKEHELLGHGAVGVVYKAQWKEREKSF